MTPEQRQALDAAEAVLRELMLGCHFEIQIFPSGGMVTANGCEECGGHDERFGSSSWLIQHPKSSSMADAVDRALADLAIEWVALPEGSGRILPA